MGESQFADTIRNNGSEVSRESESNQQLSGSKCSIPAGQPTAIKLTIRPANLAPAVYEFASFKDAMAKLMTIKDDVAVDITLPFDSVHGGAPTSFSTVPDYTHNS